MKIFSDFPLIGKLLFVTIVLLQNKMKLLSIISNQLIGTANVRNLVSVLIIVIILLVKPAGAMVV